jgi:hypothetical protein
MIEQRLPCKALASCSCTNETGLGLKDLVKSQVGEPVFPSAKTIFTNLILSADHELNDDLDVSAYLRKHFFQYTINALLPVSSNPIYIIIRRRRNDARKLGREIVQGHAPQQKITDIRPSV